MQDIDDNVVNNTISLKKMEKLEENFDEMSIGSGVTSCETISCDSTRSNLNNNSHDKMVKNVFLKIFGRYYFQKFKYNAFPEKRREDGEKEEMMDMIQWGIDRKQEENDRIERKVALCLDDMMDSIFVHEQEKAKKDTEKELVENKCDGDIDYIEFPARKNLFAKEGVMKRMILFYQQRDKQKLKQKIIAKNRLPTTDREKHINEYISSGGEKGIGISKSLHETYKEWCNKDSETWKDYLEFWDLPHLQSLEIKVKDRPKFSWDDQLTYGVPNNSLGLLDKPITLKDVLNIQHSDPTTGKQFSDITPMRRRLIIKYPRGYEPTKPVPVSPWIEVPLIDHFETPENDIDSKTTSESTPESSDPENDISSRSSSESTLVFGNGSESSFNSSSSESTLEFNNSYSSSTISSTNTTNDSPNSSRLISSSSIKTYCKYDLTRHNTANEFLNMSKVKSFYKFEKFSRVESTYFGDLDKVSGIRIKEYPVEEDATTLFSRKRKIKMKYHVTQYYNRLHDYEFQPNNNIKLESKYSWKRPRYNQFVKSIDEEDLTSDEDDDNDIDFNEEIIRSNLMQIKAYREKVKIDWQRWCDREGIIWF